MGASNEGTEMMRTSWMEFGRRWTGLAVVLLLTALVGGCGGGGAGTNGPLNSGQVLKLNPDKITTSPNVTWVFTISGGSRPYKVTSSMPDLVVLSKNDLGLDENTFSARVRDPHGTATITVTVTDPGGQVATSSIQVDSTTAAPLSVIPSALTTYFNSPALVTASGGVPPYRLISSNPAIIPNASAWSQNGDFLILARNVAEDTAVTVSIQDSAGSAAQSTVTVKPAPLLNTLTVKPVSALPGVGCGTAVCSGQDAFASVKLSGYEGGPLPGRQIRFDVVQGQYLFYSDNPAQPLVTTLTVASDQDGLAQVRLKANVNAVTGAALIRATDLTTGNRVDGNFVIAQYTDGTGTLTALPNDITFSTWYDDECSSSFSANVYIFGGTPPYRVVDAFPGSLTLEGTPVQTNGGAVTITTRGYCLDPGQLIITDATARTISVKVTARPGTHKRDSGFSPTPMAVTPELASIKCGESANFTITGGASNKYLVSTLAPQLRATVLDKTVTVSLDANISGPEHVEVSDGVNKSTLTITAAGCH